MLLADVDRVHLSRQVLQFTDEKETAEPEARVSVDTTFYHRQPVVAQSAAPASATPAPPAAEPAKPAVAQPAAQAPTPAPAPAKPAEPPPAAAKPAVSQQSTPPKPVPAAAPVSAAAPPPAAAPAPAVDGQPAVTFQDLNRHVPCSKGQTLCEVAEAAGIEIEADCHAGV